MKGSVFLPSFVLLIAILLVACSSTQVSASTSQVTTEPTMSQTILSKASTEPSAMVTVTSANTEPTADVFAAVRESNETWLSHGLRAYESGKEPMNLRAFFTSNQLNLSYLTLYEHMFVYDETTSITVAEALFRFICDEFGLEALTDLSKRTEYKTAYMNSLGINMTYPSSPEMEELFTSMELLRQSTYKYILTFDNVYFYFPDFIMHPSNYHTIMYNTISDLQSMISFIKDNNLGDYFNTDRDYHFFVLLQGGNSYTKAGMMYINNLETFTHEAVHAMGISTFTDPPKDHVWLAEGICQYLGTVMFDQFISSHYLRTMQFAAQGYFDKAIAAGDSAQAMTKLISEKYLAAGGKLEDKLDFRLFYDILGAYQFETGQYETLYQDSQNLELVGKELSYTHAASFVAYLVDNYDWKSVLEAYETQDLVGIFGKDYEALKTDWLTYLARFK